MNLDAVNDDKANYQIQIPAYKDFLRLIKNTGLNFKAVEDLRSALERAESNNIEGNLREVITQIDELVVAPLRELIKRFEAENVSANSTSQSQTVNDEKEEGPQVWLNELNAFALGTYGKAKLETKNKLCAILSKVNETENPNTKSLQESYIAINKAVQGGNLEEIQAAFNSACPEAQEQIAANVKSFLKPLLTTNTAFAASQVVDKNSKTLLIFSMKKFANDLPEKPSDIQPQIEYQRKAYISQMLLDLVEQAKLIKDPKVDKGRMFTDAIGQIRAQLQEAGHDLYREDIKECIDCLKHSTGDKEANLTSLVGSLKELIKSPKCLLVALPVIITPLTMLAPHIPVVGKSLQRLVLGLGSLVQPIAMALNGMNSLKGLMAA
jgi:hypothetical protein